MTFDSDSQIITLIYHADFNDNFRYGQEFYLFFHLWPGGATNLIDTQYMINDVSREEKMCY